MGEERVERMSYYKEDRVDEVMNECMKRMRRGQGCQSCQETPTLHNVAEFILPHTLTQC